MAGGDCMAQLGGWARYEVSNWHREQRAGLRWLIRGAENRCRASLLGLWRIGVGDSRKDCAPDSVELRIPRSRLACATSGPRLEQVDWLDPHVRMTRRLAAESVARLCTVTSGLHAARWFGLD